MPGKSKNLLKNPCAENGLDYWEVACSGGNGFQCEKEPEGCKKICDCTDVEDNLSCWSTSFGSCEKFQLVYLPEFNISEEKLDNKKPPIRIQDWYAARVDCGCKYKISVRLLADDKSTELDAWNFSDTKEEGSNWTNTPSGVRYVEFKHGGQDTKFWAGFYGVKMTNSAVFVGKKMSNWENGMEIEKSGKNLLKNPCASSGLEGWEIVSNGGDGFRCEEEPVGCKPIKDANSDAEAESCWVTSYGDCEKIQVVDLGFEGFDPGFMDETQPEIKISEWFGSRTDAGCKYWLKVRLLNSDMEEIENRIIKVKKVNEGQWHKVQESFTGYGHGVRFVEYVHGGRDTCLWKGHYGAKITCSFVAVLCSNRKKGTGRRKSGKNLLKNPCASSGLEGWEIVSDAGDGFQCEEEPVGCKPIKDANPDAEADSCWVTSYGDCEKKQVVDLGFEGFDPGFMDKTQPEIKISEWFGSRSDAGCEYWLKVRLLNSDMEEIDNRIMKETKDNEGDWYKVEESFTGYGPGVRFVEYVHGGRDTCGWAGNYGAKIACSFLAVLAEG